MLGSLVPYLHVISLFRYYTAFIQFHLCDRWPQPVIIRSIRLARSIVNCAVEVLTQRSQNTRALTRSRTSEVTTHARVVYRARVRRV
jgi:hypothetical protein